MHKGFLNLVLHAHLPYIRHPEHDYFLEENWLYEAITESYIPLLDVFDRLLNEKRNFKLTLSLSPSLVEMFNDKLLRDRYLRYINNLIELSEKEILRTKGDPSFEPLAKMYNSRFKKIRFLFEESYKKDLTSAFKTLQDEGAVEIITSAATHAYLPMFSMYPRAVKAQIALAVKNHRKNFGKEPSGIWLPECGFFPELDHILKIEGIKFFFMDTHGVLNGTPTPRYGVYKPVKCLSGVVVFGRDMDSSKQVWSSVDGYPGNPVYRDFYRDIGFELPINSLKHYLHPDGIRTYTGIKYFCITDKSDNKKPYNLKDAMAKAEEHAEDFLHNRKKHLEFLSHTSRFRPVITAPYDAELFGHWWFEGPEWLYSLLKKIADDRSILRTITPSEYINANPELQKITPAMSSWGEKGYNEVWLNNSNSWAYRHLHKATERMIELTNNFPNAKGLTLRALNQAAREVLLSQHSDWPFIIKTGRASEYAIKRITMHLGRFNLLYTAIKSGNINNEWLTEIEKRDKIFKDIDYRIYSDNDKSLS